MQPLTLTINDSIQLGPRTLVECGDIVKVKGRQGEFFFRRYVVSNRGPEWVDLLCTDHKFHSVRPDEIKKKPKKRKKG